MQIRTHLQPALQALDIGQVGESQTITRGSTDPQSTLRDAGTLQHRPVFTRPRRLPRMRKRIFGISQVP